MNQYITDDEVCSLPLHAGRAELLEEIMSTPVIDTIAPTTRRRPPRWSVIVAAAAVVLAIVAVPVWLAQRDDPAQLGPAGQPAAPGERAVLPLEGWEIDNLDDHAGEGEIRYQLGDQEIQVNWRRAGEYGDYVQDRNDLGRPTTVDLFGSTSKLWAYSPTDHTVIRPDEGAHFFEVRGTGMGKPAFLALLGQLQQVDEAGFAAALPDGMVTPLNADPVVQEVLADIETPEGFDTSTIDLGGYRERYHLIADVTGLVTCGWINQYGAAQASGDEAAEAEAVAAMAGSRDWAALEEIEADGGWSDFIWEMADNLAAGKPVSSFLEDASSCQDGDL